MVLSKAKSTLVLLEAPTTHRRQCMLSVVAGVLTDREGFVQGEEDSNGCGQGLG